MGVSVKTQYVSSSVASHCTSSGTNHVKYVTIHETANTSKGANAQAHANLQSGGNSRSASWHETVDDKQAVISFKPNVRCWHAGDGTGEGNYESYGIEICVNSDGDFKKAVDNAAQRAAYWLKKYGHDTSKLVQHNHWTGKNCPTQLRSGSKGIDWSDFVSKVKGYLSGGSSGGGSSSGKLDVDGKWGSDFTTALQKQFKSEYKDGEVSRQNDDWEDDNPGCTTGWDWMESGYGDGSPLISAMQDFLKKNKWYSDKVDGLAGPNFFKGYQKWMKAEGLYTGNIDGKIDYPSTSVKAGQKWANNGGFSKGKYKL